MVLASVFKSIAKLRPGSRTASRINPSETVPVIYRLRQLRISISGTFALRRLILDVQKISMPKQNFYAVRRGRATGVYLTWAECEAQVKQFPGAVFKKFGTVNEAEAFVKGVPSTVTKPQTSGRKRTLSNVAGEEPCTVAYSDGACKGNGKPGSVAGIGVYYGPGDPRNLAERCPGDQTNNRAELIAIVRVLETVPVNSRKLVIKSDSRYSLQCVGQWMSKWMKNGFRTVQGTPVKNAGILRYLAALLDERTSRGQPVFLQYVKGHSRDPGNDGADAQANLGTTFPSRPDLDWVALKASVSQTIDDLIQTTDEQVATVSEGVERRPGRPTKMPKFFDESTEPDMLPTEPDSKTETRVSVHPSNPLPVLSHRHSADRYPTSKEPADQPISNIKSVPALSAMSQPQPTNFSTASHRGSAISTLHHRDSTPNQRIDFSGTPKSRVKVSGISAPLIPVSPNDIDPNVYEDCLLEGEEWAKEIQSL